MIKPVLSVRASGIKIANVSKIKKTVENNRIIIITQTIISRRRHEKINS